MDFPLGFPPMYRSCCGWLWHRCYNKHQPGSARDTRPGPEGPEARLPIHITLPYTLHTSATFPSSKEGVSLNSLVSLEAIYFPVGAE